jgi:hypothetical protein
MPPSFLQEARSTTRKAFLEQAKSRHYVHYDETFLESSWARKMVKKDREFASPR